MSLFSKKSKKTFYGFLAHMDKIGGFAELTDSLGKICDEQMDALEIADPDRRAELRSIFIKDQLAQHLFGEGLYKKYGKEGIRLFLPNEWEAPLIDAQDMNKSLEQCNALISAFVKQKLPAVNVSNQVDLVASAIDEQNMLLMHFEY